MNRSHNLMVYLKILIKLFSHPHVVPNPHEFLSSFSFFFTNSFVNDDRIFMFKWTITSSVRLLAGNYSPHHLCFLPLWMTPQTVQRGTVSSCFLRNLSFCLVEGSYTFILKKRPRSIFGDQNISYSWAAIFIPQSKYSWCIIKYVTLELRTSFKSQGYICSNSQKYIGQNYPVSFYAQHYQDIN